MKEEILKRQEEAKRANEELRKKLEKKPQR